MPVACLWSSAAHCNDLYSFAAIAGKPPADVAAAGHDRYIIAIWPDVKALLSAQDQSRASPLISWTSATNAARSTVS
jgi:hypothetical protein